MTLHIDDIGEFVRMLKAEGFDAAGDLFNGQVGVQIGPKGLDAARMEAGVRSIFFPLWEINLPQNRELIDTRKFQDLVDRRPEDWKPVRSG